MQTMLGAYMVVLHYSNYGLTNQLQDSIPGELKNLYGMISHVEGLKTTFVVFDRFRPISFPMLVRYVKLAFDALMNL